MAAIKKPSYPSPCESCAKEKTCQLGYGCEAWRIRYLYRQKQINAYAKFLRKEATKNPVKFVYLHPDEARAALKEWPCKGCQYEASCDIPCVEYLKWWDMRMQAARTIV